jgi:hypothetical protein
MDNDGNARFRKFGSKDYIGQRVELLFPVTTKEPAQRGITRALQITSSNAIVHWRRSFPADIGRVVFIHGTFISEAQVTMMPGKRALLEFPKL